MANKYLHLFNNISDLNDYIQNEYEEPFTALTGGQRVDYNKKLIIDANGHEYIDLGLPSGTLWATCNLGATSPEEFGDYYAWGETEPHYDTLDPLTWKQGKTNGYSWTNYKFNPTGDGSTMTKYNSTDGLTELELIDDAARINWGGEWRIPTHEECLELTTNCEVATDGNMVYFSNNGNYIYFPFNGYYDGTAFTRPDLWNIRSSSLYTSFSQTWTLSGTKSNFSHSYPKRYRGISIRPVLKPSRETVSV